MALVSFYAFLSHLFFPTQIFTDSLVDCYYVEKAFQAHGAVKGNYLNAFGHILQNWFYYFAGKIMEFCGYHGRLLFPLQTTSILFATLAVLVMYLILLHLFKEPWSAFLTSAVLGFGYSFWFWSGQVKSYPIATFFVLLAFYFYIRISSWRGVILSSLSSVLAIGFFQGSCAFVGVMLIFILIDSRPLRKRILNAALYFFPCALFVALIYFFISGATENSYILSWKNIHAAWDMFWRASSEGQIPSAVPRNSSFFPHSLAQHLSLLAYNIVSETFIPIGPMMFSAFATIFDQSAPVLKLNPVLDYIVLSGIGLILIVFFINIKKIWPTHGKFFILSLVWLLFFGSVFFFVDATHPYLYICTVGLLIFTGTISASSKPARFILLVIMFILFAANYHQLKSGHYEDRALSELKTTQSVVRAGDSFIFGLFKGSSFGSNWSITYYYLVDMIYLEDYQIDEFNQGWFPSVLSADIHNAINKGGRVFINRTGFSNCFPPQEKDAVWKVWSSEFDLLPVFKLNEYYSSLGPREESYYMIRDKVRRK